MANCSVLKLSWEALRVGVTQANMMANEPPPKLSRRSIVSLESRNDTTWPLRIRMVELRPAKPSACVSNGCPFKASNTHQQLLDTHLQQT